MRPRSNVEERTSSAAWAASAAATSAHVLAVSLRLTRRPHPTSTYGTGHAPAGRTPYVDLRRANRRFGERRQIFGKNMGEMRRGAGGGHMGYFMRLCGSEHESGESW